MTEYRFTLRFSLPSDMSDMNEIAERLYGGGCADALIGVGHPGRVALDFTREASSARDAVMTAIADVTRAIPGALLVEAAPDLVGVTDVADLVGCSRQNIRQLMLSSPGSAPCPVHEGRQALWHLHPLLDWLVSEKQYEVSADLVDVSAAIMQVNLAMDALRADEETEDELRELFA